MARRTSQNQNEKNKAGTFFLATLILWFVSVLFEIIINKRSELLWIVAGALFFQIANWVVRSFISRDPLFVNTSVSLLHSTIISVSVVFILANQRIKNGPNGMFEHSQLVGVGYAPLPIIQRFNPFHPGSPSDSSRLLYSSSVSKRHNQLSYPHSGLRGMFSFQAFMQTMQMLFYNAINEIHFIIQLHSIFLHVRKVRRMAGVRDAKSTIVRMEWVLNWLTFIFARTLSHILITIKLIADAPRFEKGVVLPLALFGMAGMNLINAGLGIDLFNAFTRERNPQKSSSHRHGE
ncbi:hypothetical protein D5086_026738 [Populus alba]